MKQKMLAILAALVLTISLAACGGGKETTITGMVVSVDGTMISLMEMDADSMGTGDFVNGEGFQTLEGMEDFQGFEDFSSEDFAGAFPEGSSFPQWGGEMPEGMTPPEGMTLPEGMTPPEGMTFPEGMTPPEGMTMPEDGSMPNFGGGMPNIGGNGGMGTGFESFASDGETKELDIGSAHISVEIEGGKASGSMDDIKAGIFVTITMNGKGEVTNVLVSSMSGFGGMGRRPN